MIHYYPHNLRAVIAIALFLAAWFVWLMHLDSKPKKDYDAITGRIMFFDKQYQNLPLRDFGKYRYLKIDSYTYPFEMYIDDESGNHNPKLEQVENLKAGDTITVCYYETDNTREVGINRFLEFIDKNKVQIFKRGNVSGVLGTIMLGACGLLIIVAIEFYKRKRLLIDILFRLPLC